MKFNSFYYSIILIPTIFATTALTDPPTKTITEVLTITYTPTETSKNNVVTKTLYETIHDGIESDQQTKPGDFAQTPSVPVAAPANGEFINSLFSDLKAHKKIAQNTNKTKVLVPGLNVESTSGVVPEANEQLKSQAGEDEFGYDADYFQSRLEPLISNPSEKDFHELNEEIDSQVSNEEDDDDEEEFYEESEDGEDFEDDVEVADEYDIDADVEISSPYHLDPNYRGTTNPKELEKPRPADATDDINQPDPTLDQNNPLEHQQPTIDEQQKDQDPENNNNPNEPQLVDEDLSNKYTHSNFTKPEPNEEGHPIPQPIGEHDPEEEEITKGKQVLDKEETDSLVIGNKTSGIPKKIKGNKLKSEDNDFENRFIQGSIIDGLDSKNQTSRTGKSSRRPLSTTLTKMNDDTSGGSMNYISLNSVLFIVGILSGFMTFA